MQRGDVFVAVCEHQPVRPSAAAGREVVVRVLGTEDFGALRELHQRVLADVLHPHMLRPDTDETLYSNLGARGVTFGAFAGNALVAYAALNFAGHRDHDFADELGLAEGRARIAVYDGSGVHPGFRGMGLHRRLNATRRAEAVVREIEHLYGTVSVYNRWSLANHLAAGFVIRGVRMKYGGMWRLICHEDLHNPVRPARVSRAVPMADVDGHAAATSMGLVGFRVLGNEGTADVAYGPASRARET